MMRHKKTSKLKDNMLIRRSKGLELERQRGTDACNVPIRISKKMHSRSSDPNMSTPVFITPCRQGQAILQHARALKGIEHCARIELNDGRSPHMIHCTRHLEPSTNQEAPTRSTNYTSHHAVVHSLTAHASVWQGIADSAPTADLVNARFAYGGHHSRIHPRRMLFLIGNIRQLLCVKRLLHKKGQCQVTRSSKCIIG